jgi:hypothetical protein
LKIAEVYDKETNDNSARGIASDETGKTEVPCHSRFGTIKIPPCSKALSAEHRLNIAALHRQ